MTDDKKKIRMQVNKQNAWKAAMFDSRLPNNDEFIEYINAEFSETGPMRLGPFSTELTHEEHECEELDTDPISTHNLVSTSNWTEDFDNHRLEML